MAKRACAFNGCLLLADHGESYCKKCRGGVGLRNSARYKAHAQRRRAVPGDGAASRLRRRVNTIGSGRCELCRTTYKASDLEVDHRIPLLAKSNKKAGGGSGGDFDHNVWLLCHPCHKLKTRKDRGYPTPLDT